MTQTQEGTRGALRFEKHVLLGGLALVIGAVPFLALLLLVRREWEPLANLDQQVADDLNAVAAGSPQLVSALQVVTDLGGNGFALYVFALTTTWFWIRRQKRLASYVATTGIGLAVIVPLTKVLVGRPRPQVEVMVAEIPSNASFPSGHSMVALTTLGMLALVLLPWVQRRWRTALVTLVVVLVVAVGMTRLMLGVHYVTDVLSGWALGAGWLGVTTAAFRAWQKDEGAPAHDALDGVDPEGARAGRPNPYGRALPEGERSTGKLVVGGAAIVLVLGTVGLVLTRALANSALLTLDRRVVEEAHLGRTPELTEVARTVSLLGGTSVIVGLALATAVLGVAATRRRRIMAFMVAAMVGEIILYFLVSETVARFRPAVPDLTAGLPVAASWPSGHTAAAVVAYGALTVLVWHTRWRWAALGVAVVLPPLIGASRVYVAAHHPSDVVAGLVLGALWLAWCVKVIDPHQHEQDPERTPAQAEGSDSRRAHA